MKVVIKVVAGLFDGLCKVCEFILAVAGGAAIMLLVAFMAYSFYSVTTDWWTGEYTLEDDVCSQSMTVFECVRELCEEPDDCSIEKHDLVWQQCHDECVAQ